MPWVRIDDGFYDHPKFIKAGPLGIALWVTALAWCNRNLTDGFVPAPQVRRLCDFNGLGWRMWTGDLAGGGEDVDPFAVAEQLVDLEIWEHAEGGYRVHDFLKFQPSRRQVEAERRRMKEAKSEAGKRGAAVRQAGRQTRNRPASKRVANEQQSGEQPAQQTCSPVPVPIDLVSQSVTNGCSAPPKSDDDDETLRRIRQAKTDALADLADREHDLGPVTNRDAWLTKATTRRLTEPRTTPTNTPGLDTATTTLRHHIATTGRYGQRPQLDPHLDAAITHAGGWQTVCDAPDNPAKFAEWFRPHWNATA